MEVPRLATAPARVIIEAALVVFEVEGAGVGTSELTKELLAVAEWSSQPSSRASQRRLLLEAVQVDLTDFLEWGFEEELTAITDGVDKSWEEGHALVSGAAGGKSIDIFCGLGGGPVNGMSKVEYDKIMYYLRSEKVDVSSKALWVEAVEDSTGRLVEEDTEDDSPSKPVEDDDEDGGPSKPPVDDVADGGPSIPVKDDFVDEGTAWVKDDVADGGPSKPAEDDVVDEGTAWEVVPRCAAFPQAADDLHILCSSLK